MGFNMDSTGYTSARTNLARIMARLCNDHASVIITQENVAPVVIMSLDDYNAMEETTHLFRSPANPKNPHDLIAKLKAGNGTKRTSRVKLSFSTKAWEQPYTCKLLTNTKT
ncbi:MAG: antitoxin YefM [Urechidicola sp.]|jgi:antitoxin YefM